MADPVSKVEIEDVLSSIRRLVSDEARTPIREGRGEGFKSDIPPQPIELVEEVHSDTIQDSAVLTPPALVLTPALRVETQPPHTHSESESDAETNEVGEDPEEGALILNRSDSAEQSLENAGFKEHVETEVFENDDGAVDDMPEQDRGEEDESIAKGDAEALYFEDQEHSADVAEPEHTFDDDVHGQSEDDSSGEQNDEPRSIEDKIAALEALISHSKSDFEPDGEEDGANAARGGEALPWEDSNQDRADQNAIDLPDPDAESQTASFDEEAIAFQRAHSEAVETAQSELETNTTETLLENEDIGAVLDEEALRDMVAEIVRQELQGPLGERITRNVRKLVRREIYRAMAANELD